MKQIDIFLALEVEPNSVLAVDALTNFSSPRMMLQVRRRRRQDADTCMPL